MGWREEEEVGSLSDCLQREVLKFPADKLGNWSWSLSAVLMTINPPLEISKVGYHTESRCQNQPASFSSAFKLNGTACLVGVGYGVCVPGGGGEIWNMYKWKGSLTLPTLAS